MSVKRTLTEAETLEQYRVSLQNTTKNAEILAIMTEFGYDLQVIDQGMVFLTETRQAYDNNKSENDETAAAYDKLGECKNELKDVYTHHRKKAKVVFLNDTLTREKLGVTGSVPTAYLKWLEMIKKFYSVAIADTEIQNKLSRLKVTPEELTQGKTLISYVEDARAEYLREKGESQGATILKDAAFAKIDDWMREFYAVAKIALEDKPHLWEAFNASHKN